MNAKLVKSLRQLVRQISPPGEPKVAYFHRSKTRGILPYTARGRYHSLKKGIQARIKRMKYGGR